ncbi:MAG TPA: DUF6328 family protein [Rhizomicrobium sp.]|jgi:hypothetical protein
MELQKLVKVSLDELRMQMLGAQVLFGFQLQGVFQDAFPALPNSVKRTDAAALAMIVVTIGILVAAPAQHRLVERGRDTRRIFRVATIFAECALAPFALALGCDIYVASAPQIGARNATVAAVVACIFAISLWYALGETLARILPSKEANMAEPEQTHTDLHARIEQMLTESRVILPGAQALLGFQFVVTLTKAFAELPQLAKMVHFTSLAAVVSAVMFLIAPAVVHRLTFKGQDVERFHRIGSLLVTIALIPLSLGIAGDFYVASSRMLSSNGWAAISAIIALIWLVSLWYIVPLAMRRSRQTK